MNRIHPFIAALGLAVAGAAEAQTSVTASATTSSGTTSTVTVTTGSTTATPAPAVVLSPAEKRLAAGYGDFAGSSANAEALVGGLRTGSSLTLRDAYTGQTSTFQVPTRPMGDGNVRIALNLARAELAAQGITNPTPAELQGTLLGSTRVAADGSVTTQQGILQMRADGMGWGKIAHAYGFKLGAVMSGKGLAPAGTTSGAAMSGSVSSAGVTTERSSHSSHVTMAGGGSANTYGQGARSGVTTAAGVGVGGMGNAYGAGHGGGAVTAAGAASNGGAGAGHAGGHGRGKP